MILPLAVKGQQIDQQKRINPDVNTDTENLTG